MDLDTKEIRETHNLYIEKTRGSLKNIINFIIFFFLFFIILFFFYYFVIFIIFLLFYSLYEFFRLEYTMNSIIYFL